MSAAPFSISVMLMQISTRLLSAWSHLQCLKNVFVLKVKRGPMQTQGPQNNRWEDIFILHRAEWALRWKTDRYLCRNSQWVPADLLLNNPEGSMLHKLLMDDPGEWVIDITSNLYAVSTVFS